MSESFAALFEESLQRTEMRPGEVITAEVVRVEHNFVVVNAGLKSEAYVPLVVPVTNSPDSRAFSRLIQEARRLAVSRDRMVSP